MLASNNGHIHTSSVVPFECPIFAIRSQFFSYKKKICSGKKLNTSFCQDYLNLFTRLKTIQIQLNLFSPKYTEIYNLVVHTQFICHNPNWKQTPLFSLLPEREMMWWWCTRPFTLLTIIIHRKIYKCMCVCVFHVPPARNPPRFVFLQDKKKIWKWKKKRLLFGLKKKKRWTQ